MFADKRYTAAILAIRLARDLSWWLAKMLFIMLIAVIVFLPAVRADTVWVYRILRGQITLEAIRRQVGPY
jgi:hypothetical protein